MTSLLTGVKQTSPDLGYFMPVSSLQGIVYAITYGSGAGGSYQQGGFNFAGTATVQQAFWALQGSATVNGVASPYATTSGNPYLSSINGAGAGLQAAGSGLGRGALATTNTNSRGSGSGANENEYSSSRGKHRSSLDTFGYGQGQGQAQGQGRVDQNQNQGVYMSGQMAAEKGKPRAVGGAGLSASALVVDRPRL